MRIADLYWNAPSPDRDEATRYVDDSVLLEWELIDFRVTLREGRAAFIFSNRWFDFETANTCVLVATGYRASAVERNPRDHPFYCYSAVGAAMTGTSDGLIFRLGLIGDAELQISADRFDAYFGNVLYLLGAAADYGSDPPAFIRANLPDWGSHFELLRQETFRPMSELPATDHA